MPRILKKLNDAAAAQDGLQKLLRESVSLKRKLLKQLKIKPDHLGLHRVYCMYVRRVLEIQRTLIQSRSIDRESLLIAALKCVVLTLLEKGEAEAAATIGNHLEDIGEKVRAKWLEPLEPGRATARSEPLFSPPSPHSGAVVLKKRKRGSSAP